MKRLRVTVYGMAASQLPTDIKSLGDFSYLTYDLEKMMEPLDPLPEIILCFAGEISPLEIAQMLRMNYSELPIFFITHDKKEFDKKKLIKNGFSQTFILPWEKMEFFASLKDEAFFSINPELRNYIPVKVIDLIPGVPLDFGLNVYLTMANKLVPYVMQGDCLPREKSDKLAEKSVTTIYIHKDDTQKFRDYTVQTLSKYLAKGEMCETDRHKKLKTCVRDLISDFFIDDTQENTFSKSQGLLKEVKEIINQLLMDKDRGSFNKIIKLVNVETSFYQHLSNVAAYAGMFAMALEFDHPEHVAMAGMLHDIGKVNLPLEMADMEVEQLSPNLVKAYYNHSQYSVDIIKLKRISLAEPTLQAIIQHHEAMNGSGPMKVPGHKICKEGRMLAIADRFDELTWSKPGVNALSARDALILLNEENSKDPGRALLDPDMLKQLVNFFIK